MYKKLYERLRGQQYNNQVMGKIKFRNKNKISSFVQTLVQMLENQPEKYIYWNNEQCSFTIKNPSQFTEQVLPRYFKHSNLSSFVRQLNIYDFKKISNDKAPDQYQYSHPYFSKNHPQLLKNIQRKSGLSQVKINKIDSDSEKEPEAALKQSSDIFENANIAEELFLLQQQIKQIQMKRQKVNKQNMSLQYSISQQQSSTNKTLQIMYKLLSQQYLNQHFDNSNQILKHLVDRANIMSNVPQSTINQQNQKKTINSQTGIFCNNSKSAQSFTNCSSSLARVSNVLFKNNFNGKQLKQCQNPTDASSKEKQRSDENKSSKESKESKDYWNQNQKANNSFDFVEQEQDLRVRQANALNSQPKNKILEISQIKLRKDIHTKNQQIIDRPKPPTFIIRLNNNNNLYSQSSQNINQIFLQKLPQQQQKRIK